MSNKNSIRDSRFMWLILALVCTLPFLPAGCSRPEEGQHDSEEKLVKTARVEQVTPIREKQYPGVIREAGEMKLSFRVAGPVPRVYVREGEYVKQGQVIAEMDPRDYELQKAAVEAQVEQLRSEYGRIEELWKRSSVAENDYEKMKAGVEMAESKLRNASDQLQDTRLLAPFSGYIARVHIREGDVVNYGTPVASLIDISSLKVEINVPASMYLNREAITGMEFTQEDLPGQIFPLFLETRSVKANGNGLYTFFLQHRPGAGSELAPGMNVLVTLRYAEPGEGLWRIPVNALVERQGTSWVWVLSEGEVHARQVETTHEISGGKVTVIRGLETGEEVVTGGQFLLEEGRKVRPVKESSPSNVGHIL